MFPLSDPSYAMPLPPTHPTQALQTHALPTHSQLNFEGKEQSGYSSYWTPPDIPIALYILQRSDKKFDWFPPLPGVGGVVKQDRGKFGPSCSDFSQDGALPKDDKSECNLHLVFHQKCRIFSPRTQKRSRTDWFAAPPPVTV